MSLLSRPIPSTGEQIPVIGLGTWKVFDVDPTETHLTALGPVFEELTRHSHALLDSSPMYGRAEEVCGALIERHGARGKLFVATKVWTSGRSAGIEQMEASMRKMRTAPLDLLQVHNLVDVGPHLETLRAWKREGRVRYLGVTHYTAAGAEALTKLVETEAVDFIQINYSVSERAAEARLFPLARDRGVAVIANRPFATGDLLTQLRQRALPPFAAELGCTSWAQLLLKFVVGHPVVTCAIPATAKLDHLRDNLRAGTGPLPDETLRTRIAQAALQR